MTSFGTDSIADVVSACQANAQEIGLAFSRAFDVNCELSVGLGTSWDTKTPLDGLQGPGLALLIHVGSSALVAVLPESSGILPQWYAEPGPTGISRLATLAQELSMLVLPDGLPVGDASAMALSSLDAAVRAADPEPVTGRVPLVLHFEPQRRAALNLIWPLRQPDKFVGDCPTPAPAAPAGQPQAALPLDDCEDGLPSYTRSLLRVQVPVGVALACKKQSVAEILELGIGSIIHFDKPCDDPLELEVNGHCVAQGEAVKVGDKFGLRVQMVTLPNERFRPIRRG